MVMGSGCVFRCVWLCGGCVMVGSGVPSKLAQGFLQQCQLSWHCCRKPLYCRGQVVMEKHQVLTAQPPPAPSQTQRNHNPTCLTPSPLNNGNQKQNIGAMALRGEAPQPPPMPWPPSPTETRRCFFLLNDSFSQAMVLRRHGPGGPGAIAGPAKVSSSASAALATCSRTWWASADFGRNASADLPRNS